MLIVLDTNVIQEDFLLRSGRVAIVLDFALKTQATFVMPQIVRDELRANYERDLRGRLARAIRAHEQLDGILLGPRRDRVELDIAAAVSSYMQHVAETLSLGEGDIVGYRPEYLDEVLARAVARRRPCTDRGEEIRDAVLWLCVLDIAAHRKDVVAFISKNTDQFAVERVELHPDLRAEAEQRGVQIEYYVSLEEFAKRHASRIAIITPEWLEENIDSDLVLDTARDEVVNAAFRRDPVSWLRDDERGDDVSVSGYLHVDEYFVYEMADQKYRVEATWYGHADVEYDVRVRNRRSEMAWEWQWDSRHEDLEPVPVPRAYDEWTTDTREVDVRVWVITHAVVEEGKVSEWSTVEVNAERD
jgi:hypothetical protein